MSTDLALSGRACRLSIATPAFAGSLAVGLLCGYWEVPIAVWICAWAAWVAFAFRNRLALRLSLRYRARMMLVAVMVGAASIGAAGIIRVDSLAAMSVARFAGQDVVLRGIVVSSRAGGRSPEVVICASSVDADGLVIIARQGQSFTGAQRCLSAAECLRYGDITSRIQLDWLRVR